MSWWDTTSKLMHRNQSALSRGANKETLSVRYIWKRKYFIVNLLHSNNSFIKAMLCTSGHWECVHIHMLDLFICFYYTDFRQIAHLSLRCVCFILFVNTIHCISTSAFSFNQGKEDCILKPKVGYILINVVRERTHNCWSITTTYYKTVTMCLLNMLICVKWHLVKFFKLLTLIITLIIFFT